MKRRLLVLIFAVVLCALVPSAAFAVAPALLPLQGTLAGADGAPVDGAVEIRFTLYSDASGGSAIWAEAQQVAVEQGTFAVYLGQDTPLDLGLFRDFTDVYLGVAVGADAEMPLVRLATAPYAGYAALCGESLTIDGRTVEGLYSELTSRIGDTTHPRYTDAEAVAAMGTLADTNPLNHNRFAPSDAVAAMGAQGNGNPLNHARYTDAEAVAAMGTQGNSNALNHARYTDGEAVAAMGALGDANTLNHARYTDAEAVAAVAATGAYVTTAGGSTVNGNLDVSGSLTGNASDELAWMAQHAAASAACAAASPVGDSGWGHIVIPHHAGQTCAWSCANETSGNYTFCRTSIAVGSIRRTRATAYGDVVGTNYNYGCGDNQSAYDEVLGQGLNSSYTAYCCCYH